ncbi:helicase [Pseudoduganella chitinolytica]|uniref:Helicase n=1 Tax=Pseudoduganella chitinolytica TaxID=34070 RepID=A0ABY8BLX3_9BURK|nr:helicase [Pseudoduganella chitinolytica]WEF35304.1 helicase [Pseudoduganella chitinolytica]
MLKFKLLLWMLAHLLQRQARNNPDCACYIGDKDLVFRIGTASGAGRTYTVRAGRIHSTATSSAAARFTLCFRDGATGFAILSARDSQAAFLRGLGSKDLTIDGDFQEVMWFQGLSAFLQPPKVVQPYDRTAFRSQRRTP